MAVNNRVKITNDIEFKRQIGCYQPCYKGNKGW